MNELMIYLGFNLIVTCVITFFYFKLIKLLFSKKSIAIMFIAGMLAAIPVLIYTTVSHLFRLIKRKLR